MTPAQRAARLVTVDEDGETRIGGIWCWDTHDAAKHAALVATIAEEIRAAVEEAFAAGNQLEEVCQDVLDQWEGNPRQFGEIQTKRRVIAYIDARDDALGVDWVEGGR